MSKGKSTLGILLLLTVSGCDRPQASQTRSLSNIKVGQTVTLEFSAVATTSPFTGGSVILSSHDSLIVAKTQGQSYQLNSDRTSWSELLPNVAATGSMLTFGHESFWELFAGKLHYIEGTQAPTEDKVAVGVYDASKIQDLNSTTILGFTAKQVFLKIADSIYAVQFYQDQLYFTPMILTGANGTPTNAGISKSGEHVWIYFDSGSLFVAPLSHSRIDRWSRFSVSSGATSMKNVQFILSLDTNSKLTIHSAYVLEGDSLLGTSKESQSSDTPADDPTPDDPKPSQTWASVVKPISDVSCVSCHSGTGGYTSEAAWLLNKCVILNRIKIANKANSGAMPPPSATAQRSHFDANNDQHRTTVIDWLEANGSSCP